MPPAQRFCRLQIFHLPVCDPRAATFRCLFPLFLFHAIPEPFQSDFYLLSEKFHHDFSSQRNDHSNRGNHIDSCKKDCQQQPIQHTEVFFSLPLLLCCNFPSRLSFPPRKNRINRNANPKMLMPTPAFSPGSSNENTTSFSPSVNVIPKKAAKYRLDIHSFSVLYTLPSVYRNERNKQRFSLCRRHTHMNLCIAL